MTQDQQIEVGSATCGNISSDGQWIVVGAGNRATLWNVTSKESVGYLVGHSATLNHVAFSHDALRVVTAAEDATVRVWDTHDLAQGDEFASYDELIPLEFHRGGVSVAEFDPTGQYLVSAGLDGETIIWPANRLPCTLQASQTNLDFPRPEPNSFLAISDAIRLVSSTISNLYPAVA